MQEQLPPRIDDWFAGRGWHPYAHQLAMVSAARDGAHALLIAPTGGGKTLAGFLPSLITLAETPAEGLHTLYVSPLKALTVDVHRNVEIPIAEMGLDIRAETRTGDTPQSKRDRQRRLPPNLLLTTPESLSLLLSYPDSADLFDALHTVVVDELHALIGTKRGDLLALGLARLASLAPQCRRVGLSATVAWPDALRAWLSPNARAEDVPVIRGADGAEPDVSILIGGDRLPWSGHMALYALEEIYATIRQAGTTIVFVNTRATAEIVFQGLWRLNDDNLPIALHHGSLDVEQRRKVEAAMARGDLRAVVATSSLDLGVDWAAVDLVMQIGAPKGASRLIQRVGRAGHRIDRPSRAVLVPGNRFEVLECKAALDAVYAGSLDGDPPQPGGFDVLAQHLLGMSCARPFEDDAMFAEVRRAAPYAELSRIDFDDTLGFVENGGYALGGYERYRRLKRDGNLYRIASPRAARACRMNVGTIVEAVMLKVRMRRGRALGEIEESFIQGLVAGDTFVFAGRLLQFVALRETTAIVEPAMSTQEPRVPAYAGGRFSLTTHLAERVRGMLSDDRSWSELPTPVSQWLTEQQRRSLLPEPESLLIETFPRNDKFHLVAYCFGGRNVHQTLGMLLTRRMERAGQAPLGFVATEYALGVWSARPATGLDSLFEEDMLGDDLEEWMEESSMLRRTFRNVAIIAGLIERGYPSERKSRRQVTVSSDLIYDVLRRHEPNHILLRATRADAARGLTDIRRLAAMLARVKGRIVHRALDRVSPLAVPILLQIGREQVYGAAFDMLVEEAGEELAAEAMAGMPEPALS